MYYWKKINLILIVVLFLLLIPSIYAWLLPGFLVTDDATWMVVRFSAFFDSLKDGQIPVRVLERLNNGYGYPVANFLYPGFMYIASIFHIAGLGFVDSVKGVLMLSMVLSGLLTYFWLKKIFDPVSSFVGSLFYVYTPYHLYDLNTRGSVGEILAFAWIPFIFWQIERRSVPLVAFGIFFLIISHNSLALLTLPVIGFYALIQKKVSAFILSFVLGLIMSSFFIIPALTELGLTKFSTVKISNPLEYFADLNLIGYSTIAVVILLFSVLIFQRSYLKLINQKWLLLFFVTVLLTSIFLSSGLSSFAWKIFPSEFIQFPFRMLSLTVISVAFISAFTISKLRVKTQLIVSILLLVVLGFSAYSFILPKDKTFNPDEYYTTNQDTTTVKDEYLPTWVKTKPSKMPDKKVELVSGSGEISIIKINSRRADIDLTNLSNAVVRLNYIYYPGWKAYMNNEQLKIDYSNDLGVMDVKADNINGKLTFIFGETPVRYISNMLTALALIGGLLLFIRPILKFK